MVIVVSPTPEDLPGVCERVEHLFIQAFISGTRARSFLFDQFRSNGWTRRSPARRRPGSPMIGTDVTLPLKSDDDHEGKLREFTSYGLSAGHSDNPTEVSLPLVDDDPRTRLGQKFVARR